MLNSIEIEEILLREEFELHSNNERAHGFTHNNLDWVLYVKTPSGNTKSLFVRDNPLVVTPRLIAEIDRYSALCGVTVNAENFYHNSNLKGYDKRINKGKKPIEHGIDISFDTDLALLTFLDLLLGHSTRKPPASADADIESAESELKKESKTTRLALVEARRGQGKYRDELIDLWKLCSVSEFSMKEFLRASHIKPWRDSSNSERLDKFNGLLLNPILDIAFDRGFVSFSDSGTIIICEKYTDELRTMGVHRELKLKKVYPEQLRYLNWHRSHVLRK
ncbi:HNH endonuclease [Vibrionales bacterium C3R12]|nr:HNH endonuclease [Vibrionales bacterium C3R12]